MRDALADGYDDDRLAPDMKRREPPRRELRARDLDFDDAPRQSARSVSGARAKPLRKKSNPALWRRVLGAFAARPAASLFIIVFGSAVMGILVNALALQKERHPAPLFSPAVNADKDREGTLKDLPRQAAIPVPAPRPAPAAAAALPEAASPRAEKPAIVTGSADARIEYKAKDPIAQFLKTGLSAPTPAPAAEPKSNVAAAQRSLVKLGYVLRADGVAGVSTKLAIESFERERHLPVKGELSARIMREIAAAAWE